MVGALQHLQDVLQAAVADNLAVLVAQVAEQQELLIFHLPLHPILVAVAVVLLIILVVLVLLVY
jgi:uncharacterized membrane protein YidH (DUF202 family)